MKSVLISIQPKWCEKIANGEKTLEVRKTKPSIDTPFKCYIYCTKSPQKLVEVMKDGDNCYGETYHGKPIFITRDKEFLLTACFKAQKIIGEFICDKIEEIQVRYAEYGLGYNENNTCKIGNDIVVFERNDRYIDSMFTPKEIHDTMQLSCEELYTYLKNKHNGYAWHISQLKIYNKPKELGEFSIKCKGRSHSDYCNYEYYCPMNNSGNCNENLCIPITRPPQSWQYVEVQDEV